MVDVRRGDAVPVAALILDGRTLNVEWGNEYAMDMLSRFVPGPILGRPAIEFMSDASAIDIESALNRAHDTGEPTHLRTRIDAPHGLQVLLCSIYRIPEDKLLLVAVHERVIAGNPQGD